MDVNTWLIVWALSVWVLGTVVVLVFAEIKGLRTAYYVIASILFTPAIAFIAAAADQPQLTPDAKT